MAGITGPLDGERLCAENRRRRYRNPSPPQRATDLFRFKAGAILHLVDATLWRALSRARASHSGQSPVRAIKRGTPHKIKPRGLELSDQRIAAQTDNASGNSSKDTGWEGPRPARACLDQVQCTQATCACQIYQTIGHLYSLLIAWCRLWPRSALGCGAFSNLKVRDDCGTSGTANGLFLGNFW